MGLRECEDQYKVLTLQFKVLFFVFSKSSKLISNVFQTWMCKSHPTPSAVTTFVCLLNMMHHITLHGHIVWPNRFDWGQWAQTLCLQLCCGIAFATLPLDSPECMTSVKHFIMLKLSYRLKLINYQCKYQHSAEDFCNLL